MVNELQEVQWAYLLSPEFELINSAGKPLTGGWLEVYIHGTRTKYYCASDFTGTLHPFKIPLDSLGANIVLASPANAYDVYCYNKYGTLVMSRYNVLPQVAGTSIVSGGVVLDSSDGTITIEQTGDNIYDLSVSDIIDSVTANIDESITNIEGDITEINQSITGINQDITEINQDITNITNVVTGLPTHADVYDAVVTGIDYTINTVTGLIPEAQVQSDWDETNPDSPAYIDNKPDLDIYVTEQELVEAISGISGLNLEYGQFYCQTTTGGAVMGRTKGNIEVDNTGKIKLKKGQSYHVTVRGGYSKATASADYNVLSYIEYITGQNINVNVDNSVTDTQYFEISYDIYNLSTDKDYYVFFSLPTGSSVNNLFIEIHSLGGAGNGSGGGTPVEYDAGWGIEILDHVISVDPSILNEYVTENELATAIENVIDVVTGLIPEAQVQADWDEDNPLDPSYINNKPDLDIYVTDQELIEAISGVTGSFVQEQSDWAEQDSTKVDFIKNKPVEKQLVAGSNIVITESATGVIISSTGGGGASGTVQNMVEYVDSTTTPNFFTDCVTLLAQGIEPVAKYQGNVYQLWRSESNGLTYTALGFICEHYHDFQYGGISYDHQFAYNAQLWATPDGVYPGIDRAGYNYLAGDGINAVTGIVNGEHAITYSIDPMEVATAVSGLIPTGSNYSAGDGIDITNNTISVDNTVALKSDIPDVSNFVTETELQDGLELVTGLIPTDYATDEELQDSVELVTGMIPDVSDFVTEAQVSAMIPEQEDVEFLELVAGTNITLTETATGIVIDATGGGGGSYTAGNGIDITNDVISVDNTVALKTDIPDVSDFVTEQEVSGMIPEQEEVEFLELTAGDNISIASGVISVTGMPDITGLATKTELQDGLELVTGLIPTDYATIEDIEESVSGKSDKFTVLTYNSSTWAEFIAAFDNNAVVFCKYQDSNGYIHAPLAYKTNNSVIFSVLLHERTAPRRDYAYRFTLTNGSVWSKEEGYVAEQTIPGNGLSASYNSETDRNTLSINPVEVARAVSGLLPIVSNTAGITDIQYVQALPVDPVSSVLYLIPET